MQTWVNFWTFFFWLSLFLFIYNPLNFLNLLIYSEFIWTILYCYTVLLSSINDDILLFCTTFFLLALAGLEFCFGFLLIILFRHLNKSINLNDVDKTINQIYIENHNKLYLNKLFFNKK